MIFGFRAGRCVVGFARYGTASVKLSEAYMGWEGKSQKVSPLRVDHI